MYLKFNLILQTASSLVCFHCCVHICTMYRCVHCEFFIFNMAREKIILVHMSNFQSQLF